MIKIVKTGKTDGVLEMRGAADELTAETILIMRTLAQRLESISGIPAADHISAMANVATDDRMAEAFDKLVEEQPGVDLGSVLWKWGNGDEP